jgi:hypothetical protein
VISASGKTDESLLIQIDVTASAVQRSHVRMSSNKRENIYSDRIRKLEDGWTKRTGKKENWKEKLLESFYMCVCCHITM